MIVITHTFLEHFTSQPNNVEDTDNFRNFRKKKFAMIPDNKLARHSQAEAKLTGC